MLAIHMFSDDYNYDLDDVLPDSAWDDDEEEDELWDEDDEEGAEKDEDDFEDFDESDLLSLMDDDADDLDIPYSDDE